MVDANPKNMRASGFLAQFSGDQSNRNGRRYTLKAVDGRQMLVRDEVCRAVDEAISEVYGTALKPDDKDGTFLD